jgi:hypothetical protein
MRADVVEALVQSRILTGTALSVTQEYRQRAAKQDHVQKAHLRPMLSKGRALLA